jgi:drug/metabolite transporter (DMT)-like permease
LLALIIAVLAGFIFCLAAILMRKEIYLTGESYTPIPISCISGALLFGFAILATGEVRQLSSVAWQAAVYLSAAGIVHFVIGRMLVYIAYRLIGVNRSNPIINCNILVSVIGGIIFLGEPFTGYLALAVVLILAGIIFIGRTSRENARGEFVTKKTLLTGIFLVLAGSLCWGTSPLLVKVALGYGISSLPAAFISYAAAAVTIAFSLTGSGNRAKLVRLNRRAVTMIVIASASLAGAHLMRYFALDWGAVSLVSPIFSSTSSLFVFPLSFLINRKIETFSPAVIIGAVFITAGVLLIFLKV